MPELRIKIPDELLYRIEQERPNYLDRKAFVCLLLASALDRPVTLGGPSAAGTPSSSYLSSYSIEEDKSFKNNTRARELLTPRDMGTNPRAKRDPYSRKQLPEDAVPTELADLEDLLREFWSVKKGTRSERAWKRLCNKLRTFAPKDREPALQAACNAGWADIYEPAAPRPRGGHFGANEPEPKHPAGRLFQNGRFVDEEPPVTNPLLKGAF